MKQKSVDNFILRKDAKRKEKSKTFYFSLVAISILSVYGLALSIQRHKKSSAINDRSRGGLFDVPYLLQSLFGNEEAIIQEPSNADLKDVLTNLLFVSNSLLPPLSGFRECIADGRVPSQVTHAATFGDYDFSHNKVCSGSHHQPRPDDKAPRICSPDALYCPVIAASEFIPGLDAPAVTCCLADVEKGHLRSDAHNQKTAPVGAPLFQSTPTLAGVSEVFATISMASDEDWGGETGNRKSPPVMVSPDDRKNEIESHKRAQALGEAVVIPNSDHRRPMDLVFVIDLSPSMGDREPKSFHDRFNWDPQTKFHQARQLVWNIMSHYRRHLNELDRIAIIGIKTSRKSGGPGSAFAPESETRVILKQPFTAASSGNWNIQECLNERLWVEENEPEGEETEAERGYMKENPALPKVEKTYRYPLSGHRAIEKGIELAGQLLAAASGSSGLQAEPVYKQGSINKHILVVTDAFSTTTTTGSMYVPEGQEPPSGTRPKTTRTIRGRNIINYSGLKKVLTDLGEKEDVGVSIAMIGSGDDEKLAAIPMGVPTRKGYTPINASFSTLPIKEAARLLSEAIVPRLPTNQQSLVLNMVSSISRIQAFPINCFSELEAFHSDFVFYHLQPSAVDVRITVQPSRGWKVRKVYGNLDGFQSEFGYPEHDHFSPQTEDPSSTLVHRISALYPKGANRPTPAKVERTVVVRFQQTPHTASNAPSGKESEISRVTVTYIDVRTGQTVRHVSTIKMPITNLITSENAGVRGIGGFVYHGVPAADTRVTSDISTFLETLSSSEATFNPKSYQPKSDVIAASYEFKATQSVLAKAASLAIYVDLLQEWMNSFQRTPMMPLQAPEGFSTRFEQMARWLRHVPIAQSEGSNSNAPTPRQLFDCDGSISKDITVLERLAQVKTLVSRYGGYMMFHLPH